MEEYLTGEKFLGYDIKECIGAGGFGQVYRVVKNNSLGTMVRALKVITIPENENEYISVLNSMGGNHHETSIYFKKEIEKVRREIQVFNLLSAKDNKHIVQYYESDIERISPYVRRIYILMEYLKPLSKCIISEDLKVTDAIKVGLDLLDALSLCHENDIMHRDIKLDNIFVSETGNYKLGDFGVSKMMKGAHRASSVKGTPNFIAPEVYLGKEEYDASVDLYSVGIVLYYLLNNFRLPFIPDYPAAYDAEDEDRAFVCRMRGVMPSKPMNAQNLLGDVILKAIRNRDERYKDTESFKRDLMEAKENLNSEMLSSLLFNKEENRTGAAVTMAKEAIAKNRPNPHEDLEKESAACFENRDTERPVFGKIKISSPKDDRSDGTPIFGKIRRVDVPDDANHPDIKRRNPGMYDHSFSKVERNMKREAEETGRKIRNPALETTLKTLKPAEKNSVLMPQRQNRSTSSELFRTMSHTDYK